MSLRPSSEVPKGIEPSRLHWKADSSSQTCTDPSCAKPFNLFSRRKHHCRLCGFLFCQDCLFLERRLNQFAKPDPIQGVASRVCRGCFFDPSPPDEIGNVFDKTADFKKSRERAFGIDHREAEKKWQHVVKTIAQVCDQCFSTALVLFHCICDNVAVRYGLREGARDDVAK